VKLVVIPVSQLTAADVGSRAIATQRGVAFDGTLTELDITRSDYTLRDRPQITALLTLKTFVKKKLMDTTDRPSAEIKLRDLPLDYLIQIERKENN